ncbi:TPA: bifunctional hydroxymethylpyrimidine kinase/phosphomethylpyrimidine kinase [Streptococcus equi subsp. zooepidemicus]|nr:bifunctional hydroxymethylpyrimidine kinase/phosphomethylpyrimidine kinase [Streptococcus equi subsp. zooepidemicus]HEL1230333.1 bifunctional hydroxymethylpyrimidine kinase/phosphomethylpyrimidine kinase [Streptococcus equi subsp. zooepidemicus]
MKNKVLTIAGSDILSGGGLQADLAVLHQLDSFAFLAVTCLTSCDAKGFDIHPVAVDLLAKQLSSLAAIPFQAIKVGLLPRPEIAEQVALFLELKKDTPVILDPVLVFKENQDQTVVEMTEALRALFPLSAVITPNLREAERLAGLAINSKEQMVEAAKKLYEMGAKRVVIKGGNRFDQRIALDLFYDAKTLCFLEKPVLAKQNSGAGCSFAAAIAAYLAKGYSPLRAVEQAKDLVFEAIQQSNDYGVVL